MADRNNEVRELNYPIGTAASYGIAVGQWLAGYPATRIHTGIDRRHRS